MVPAPEAAHLPLSVVTVVLTILLCVPAVTLPYGSGYDEGLALSAGTFIGHGLAPYRDFYWIYGPASGYLVAALMPLLDQSVEAFRVVGLIGAALQALVAFQLIVRWTNPLAAMTLAVTASTIPLYLAGPGISAWSLAMLAATGALLIAARGGDTATRIAAGLLIGVAGLFRLDLGAYAAIAALIAYRDIRFAIGAAILGVPAALVLLLAVPFDNLVSQLIWYPLIGTRQFRAVPLPNPFEAVNAVVGYFEAVIQFGPLLVLAGAWKWLRGHPSKHGLALATFGTLTQLQALGRADLFHAAQAFPPAVLLVSLWIPVRWSHARGQTLFAALLCVPLIAVPPLEAMGRAKNRPPWDRALDQAVAYAVINTQPSDPIFVGLTQNRYTMVNPMLAYFLANRAPATRFTMYNPGVTNTEATQRTMVDDLKRTRPAVLILERTWSQVFEKSNDSRMAGSTVLDDFIAENYEIALDDEVTVMRLSPTAGESSVDGRDKVVLRGLR